MLFLPLGISNILISFNLKARSLFRLFHLDFEKLSGWDVVTRNKQQFSDRWYQFGLVQKKPNPDTSKRWLNPGVCFLLALTFAIKQVVILKFDTKENALMLGNIASFVTSSSAAAFYANVAKLIIALYLLLFQILCYFDDDPDIRWLKALDCLVKNRSEVDIEDKFNRKLMTIAALSQKFEFPISVLSNSLIILVLCFPYIFAPKTLLQCVLVSCWLVHFLAFSLLYMQTLITQTVGFSLLCYIAVYSIRTTQNKIATHASLVFGVVEATYLRKQFLNLMNVFKLIKSCNAYFSIRLKLYFINLFAALLVIVYMFGEAQNYLEFVIFLTGLILLGLCIAFFFVCASLVNIHVSKLYCVLNKHLINLEDPKIKWHQLLMIELLASKKFRIGFKIKYWCQLNKLVLLKV